MTTVGPFRSRPHHIPHLIRCFLSPRGCIRLPPERRDAVQPSSETEISNVPKRPLATIER